MPDLTTRPQARPTPASGVPPINSTVEFLASVKLFHELDIGEIRAFAELVREKNYPRSSVIVFEDDPGDSFFIVQTGRVKVVKVSDDGREVILAVLGPGEYFGELALIDNRPRSAHVIAMEDTILLVLRREDFRKRVEASPQVAWALLTELSRRLRETDQKFYDNIALDVPGRICRLLLDAAAVGDGVAIDKPLTHQVIAQMIGASRETVSRNMKDFQEAGWISVERRRISLRNLDALRDRTRIR